MEKFIFCAVYYERLLAFSQHVIICNISWYCFFFSRRGCRFLENCLWRSLVDDFAYYILAFDDGVLMLVFLYSFSLLYLKLYLECFELEQICFSFLMLHFVKECVCRVSVCHICLALSSFNFSVRPFVNIFFSFMSCFSLLFSDFSVSISSFSFPTSSLLVYAGTTWEKYIAPTHKELWSSKFLPG